MASRAWITEVALRQLQGGADALETNAGAGPSAHAARTLAEAARRVRPPGRMRCSSSTVVTRSP
ncbi:MAG: hypothetical protein U0360_05780 [Dehalococcoidia bacterium]